MSHSDAMTAENTLFLPDLDATEAFARRIAPALRNGDVVALTGPLGAGKTALAREIILCACRAAGVAPPSEVPSPTYTLVQTYDAGPRRIWHFDLYRLERPEDAEELAVFDAFAGGISLIEWPERLGPLLPADRLEIALGIVGDGRRARLTGTGPRGRALAAAIAEQHG